MAKSNVIQVHAGTFSLPRNALSCLEYKAEAYEEAMKYGYKPNQADRLHYRILKKEIAKRYEKINSF